MYGEVPGVSSWSLWAFAAIFVFCLCADWVCPCDPQAVVDLKTLEKYRESVVERSYEVKTARFNRLDSGEIVLTVRYDGSAFDPQKTDNPLAWTLVSHFGLNYAWQAIAEDGFTNSVSMVIR